MLQMLVNWINMEVSRWCAPMEAAIQSGWEIICRELRQKEYHINLLFLPIKMYIHSFTITLSYSRIQITDLKNNQEWRLKSRTSQTMKLSVVLLSLSFPMVTFSLGSLLHPI